MGRRSFSFPWRGVLEIVLSVLYIPSETIRDGSPTTHEKKSIHTRCNELHQDILTITSTIRRRERTKILNLSELFSCFLPL
ncbi:MAG: hypothetical protein H6544_04160 [Prevotellaceae bacterium]|nr:hypothetical protein [Prevotellaceae bacterium]